MYIPVINVVIVDYILVLENNIELFVISFDLRIIFNLLSIIRRKKKVEFYYLVKSRLINCLLRFIF